jgi:lipid A 3-O-deacylase
LNFYNAGLQVGRTQSAAHGGGIFRGRGEALVELIPFWLGDYPKQADRICFASGVNGGQCFDTSLGPYHRYGASITPLLLRWNFTKKTPSRSLPWAQLDGGLLWTNHEFPLLGGGTSVMNFTPQVSIGESLFIRKNRSFDCAVKAVHISNAGLGNNNPGLNVTLQFSVGYSWWK